MSNKSSKPNFIIYLEKNEILVDFLDEREYSIPTTKTYVRNRKTERNSKFEELDKCFGMMFYRKGEINE